MILASVGECMVELTGSHVSNIRSTPVGFGGDTFNTAAYWAYLADQDAGVTVKYVTALGDDAISSSMAHRFNQLGIDISSIVQIEGALPGVYLIETDDSGERVFRYWRSQSAATRMFTAPWLEATSQSLRGASLVYLSGITAAILDTSARNALIECIAGLSEAGSTVAFDPNYRAALWSTDAATAFMQTLGPWIDIVLPSMQDHELIYGASNEDEAIRKWQAMGAKQVVLKNEQHPVLVCTAEHGVTQTKPPVLVDAIDTTAAGDSFNAAFLYAHVTGCDVHEAVARGHALAARVVKVSGALLPELG